MNKEYEIIKHPQISDLNIFVIAIEYRTAHMHRDLELNLVLEGRIEMLCNNKSFSASKGEFVLINPNQLHELRTGHGKDAVLLCMQVSPKLFRETVPDMENIFFDEVKPLEVLEAPLREDIVSKVLALAQNYFQRGKHYELVCTALLNMIMYFVLQNLPFHTISRNEYYALQKKTDRLYRILDYIDNNYMRKILLSDLAEKENLTLSHLSCFIKENLNQSFQDYVNNLRFNQAKKLLLSGEKRMIDVSIESGFSDPKYMIACFLKNTGMRPEAYKKKYFKQSEISDLPVHKSEHSAQRYFSRQEAIAILGSLQPEKR